MKNKKFLTAFGSIVMASVMAASVFAGCQKEEHFYSWKIDFEATCSKAGQRTGVCADCGDVKVEEIPIDPTAHVYGEWEINAPSTTSTGTATKICELNNAHKETVTLPVITEEGTGYASSEVTTPATSISEGVRTYVYPHAEGDIKVEVKLPKKAVTTVEDAVLLGSSKGDRVRKSVGRYTEAATADSVHYNNFTTLFGDDYTHIVDLGFRAEYWYSRDEQDRPFGLQANLTVNSDGTYTSSVPKAIMDPDEQNLNGYGYESGGGNGLRTYGAEGTLKWYYDLAVSAINRGLAVDYKEELNPVQGGGFDGVFSYGYYENPNFCLYKVEFSLDAEGVIKTLKLTTTVVRSYMIAEDAEGNKFFKEDGGIVFAEEYQTKVTGDGFPDVYNEGDFLFELDEKGRVIYGNSEYQKDENGKVIESTVTPGDYKTDSEGNYLIDAKGDLVPRPQPLKGTKTGYYSYTHSEVSVRILEYTEQVLKTPDDVVPKNPYDSNSLYISSFDVTYAGNVIGDDYTPYVPSNKDVRFKITNIQPVAATLDFDPMIVYLRTDIRDYELTINAGDNPKMVMGGFLRDSGEIFINSRTGGEELTFVIKTLGGRAEKVIKVNMNKAAPTSISAQAYAYSHAGGYASYNWETFGGTSHASVYVGQPLLIRAQASDSEVGYVDTSFKVEYRGTYKDNVKFTDTELDGEKVVSAVIDRAGSYIVYVMYTGEVTDTGAGKSYASFTIDVAEPPEYSQIFSGDYFCTMEYMQIGQIRGSIDVEVNFSYGNNWRSGNVTLKFANNTATYGYAVATGEDGKAAVTLTYINGVKGETLDFTLKINEAYRLVLEHSTVFEGETEERVLLRADELASEEEGEEA